MEQREAASNVAKLQMLKQQQEAAAKVFKAAEKAFQQVSKEVKGVPTHTDYGEQEAREEKKVCHTAAKEVDKAAADATAKKVAKPAVPKAVVQKRQPVASPEKNGTSNITKRCRGGKSPRRALETLVGPVPTQARTAGRRRTGAV